MQVEVRRWVHKAESDLKCARQLADGTPRLNDVICFHCQQAAEKYLKALLQELGMAVPRTHDLGDLLDQLVPHARPFSYVQQLVRRDGGGRELESAFVALHGSCVGAPFIAGRRLLDIANNDSDGRKAVAVEVKLAEDRAEVLFADG